MRPSAQPVYRNFDHADRPRIDPQASPASLACDVSFASEDSTPPQVLVARQVEKVTDPKFAALWWNILERLGGDEVIAHPAGVLAHVQQAIRDAGCDANWLDAIFRFFDHVNRVMFQQQTLCWLAESEFKLHLYGAGWENHPTLARYARGEIDSDSTRLAIYRASRINLAANVYGAVTPRTIEGIGVGGFFLMRFTPADLLERFYPPLAEFCAEQNIETNAQLIERATPAIRTILDFASRTLGVDLLHAWPDFVAELHNAAAAGYTSSAAAVWPQYPGVSFSSKDELLGLVGRYLYDVPGRQRLADDMRRQVVTRFAHISVNPRLVADPLAHVAA